MPDELRELLLDATRGLREQVKRCESDLRRETEAGRALRRERRQLRSQLRSEAGKRQWLESELAELQASPWIQLPYYGRVPRTVGPDDPLRKLGGTLS